MILNVRSRFHVTPLLVTHDIDESMYFGDRVVVLSNRPTRVRDIVTVDLDGPRDQLRTKSDPRFLGLRNRVYTGVHSHSAAGAGSTPSGLPLRTGHPWRYNPSQTMMALAERLAAYLLSN